MPLRKLRDLPIPACLATAALNIHPTWSMRSTPTSEKPCCLKREYISYRLSLLQIKCTVEPGTACGRAASSKDSVFMSTALIH